MIAAAALERICEVCDRRLAIEETSHGCRPCFDDGRLTLFCSRECRLLHERQQHLCGCGHLLFNHSPGGGRCVVVVDPGFGLMDGGERLCSCQQFRGAK